MSATALRAQPPHPIPPLPAAPADSVALRATAGRLAGDARDRSTQQPLPYATIEVLGLHRRVLAGADGRFLLADLPAGIYTVRASRVGHAAIEIPDVIVRPAKTTQLVVELEKRDLLAAPVVVRADPFAGHRSEPTSRQELSYEEVRRAPGSAADISRTVQALPGVSHTSDQASELVVRGGAPTENLTLLDDVPIPNPNHFPEYGGAGGAISMLNVELIRGVAFSSGGFPVEHGDRLSSVLEIKLRDGNQSEFSGDLDISMAGAGLVLEGPFDRGRGSFLLSGRRSYLDVLATRVNSRTVPHYSDVQGKVAWRPDARNTISLLGVAGFDEVTLDTEEDAYSRGFDYVDVRDVQFGAGLTWKRLVGDRGHALLTIHRSENNYGYDVRDRLRPGAAPESAYAADVWEAETGLRARTVLRLVPSTDLTVGGEVRRVRYRHFTSAFADTAQEALPTPRPDSVLLVTLPRNDVRRRDAATKGALFASVERRFGPRLVATAGLRWDRFDLGGQEGWSPRGGLTWRIGERWTARASAGLFHQTPTSVLLTRTPSSRQLPYMRAAHFVLGVDCRMAHGTQATLETYAKRYRDLPVAVARGSYALAADGGGEVRGLELFVQQRLLDRWYGLASWSWSRSERTDRIFGTYPDDWDYRHVLTLLAGFRPRRNVEVSARWRYVGGRPFTELRPRFEVTPDGLVRAGTGYFVGLEGPYNGSRLPAYHRLDLRFDSRHQIGRFHVVGFVDLENVYDRDNVLAQRYSHERRDPEPAYQWKLLPVGGFSLEF